MSRDVRRCVLRVALVGLTLLTSARPSHADAISDLDQAFKDSYRLAAMQTLGTLRTSVPVLVNRFEQIALYRPGVEQPELFSMDAGPYLQASAVSHTAAALDARMSSAGLGKLGEDRLAWLARYQSL